MWPPWYIVIAPPPDRQSAVTPTVRRTWSKNWALSSTDTSAALDTAFRPVTTSSR